MTAEEITRILKLSPHPKEGGFFKETYRSDALDDNQRHHSTAIYYLLTAETYSRLHRLRSDEVFHFYAGDTVEMLQLYPDGTAKTWLIGNALLAGERPQVLAPGGVWQGSRLRAGGTWALLGCTVAPGFEYQDYEHVPCAYFLERYPDFAAQIKALTPEDETA